jgi:hypothetical protein
MLKRQSKAEKHPTVISLSSNLIENYREPDSALWNSAKEI